MGSGYLTADDRDGRQAHCGRDGPVPDGHRYNVYLSNWTDQDLVLRWRMKAPADTRTCLFVYFTVGSWLVIAKTDAGSPGSYSFDTDHYVPIEDDDVWHTYAYHLNYVTSAAGHSSSDLFTVIEFWENSGVGTHTWYLDDMVIGYY